MHFFNNPLIFTAIANLSKTHKIEARHPTPTRI